MRDKDGFAIPSNFKKLNSAKRLNLDAFSSCKNYNLFDNISMDCNTTMINEDDKSAEVS